jgi:ribosome maturation factor RimP
MGGLEDRIKGLAREVADGMGVELVEVALLGSGKRSLLRITIDRPGGVKVGDCERFSRDIGAMLDVEDYIQASYTLEVSSPGLDRPLKEAGDFRRHLGKTVKVDLREKVEGRGSWSGTIAEALDDRVRLLADGKEIELRYDNMTKARLEIEIK